MDRNIGIIKCTMEQKYILKLTDGDLFREALIKLTTATTFSSPMEHLISHVPAKVLKEHFEFQKIINNNSNMLIYKCRLKIKLDGKTNGREISSESNV